MNVFIDSNILFEDYFFENKSNKNLLEYCKEGLLYLYMSEIVRLELRRQFQKELESKNTIVWYKLLLILTMISHFCMVWLF
jgi:hypothetical protein